MKRVGMAGLVLMLLGFAGAAEAASLTIQSLSSSQGAQPVNMAFLCQGNISGPFPGPITNSGQIQNVTVNLPQGCNSLIVVVSQFAPPEPRSTGAYITAPIATNPHSGTAIATSLGGGGTFTPGSTFQINYSIQ